MRHRKSFRKLNRTSSHRKSLLMNMAVSLFKHEQIKTTLPKAKTLRPFVEKLITKSRDKSLHTIRYLESILHDSEIVNKLISEIGPKSTKRNGGYTRIYKFGFRYGDAAPMAIIELVDKTSKTQPSSNAKKAVATKNKETKDVGNTSKIDVAPTNSTTSAK